MAAVWKQWFQARSSTSNGYSSGHSGLQKRKCSPRGSSVQIPVAHLQLRFPDGVYVSVEARQDRGTFVGPLRFFHDHLRKTMCLLCFLGTSIPVAKPFYNRLQAFICILEKVTVPLKLRANNVEDTRWFLALFRSDTVHTQSASVYTSKYTAVPVWVRRTSRRYSLVPAK
jgi:hypothetical protein